MSGASEGRDWSMSSKVEKDTKRNERVRLTFMAILIELTLKSKSIWQIYIT